MWNYIICYSKKKKISLLSNWLKFILLIFYLFTIIKIFIKIIVIILLKLIEIIILDRIELKYS